MSPFIFRQVHTNNSLGTICKANKLSHLGSLHTYMGCIFSPNNVHHRKQRTRFVQEISNNTIKTKYTNGNWGRSARMFRLCVRKQGYWMSVELEQIYNLGR